MWAWVWPGISLHSQSPVYLLGGTSKLFSYLSVSDQWLEIFAVFIVIYPPLSPHCAWGPTVDAVPHVHMLGVSSSPQCLPRATRR